MNLENSFKHVTLTSDSLLADEDVHAFRAFIYAVGQKLYRDFPWRNTTDPYEVWISEVMLQQTQVQRVQGRWERFIAHFPTVDALAAAAPVDVVEEWQGMGYNRRALALHKAASQCAEQFGGAMPQSESDLLSLPGIGPSTAGGIMAFAFDEPALYLETNVRSVFIHHFFPNDSEVSDKLLKPLVLQTCPDEHVRAWYYALLDYGAYLKKTVTNPSRKAKAYTRQSTFEGSRRQKRAWLVREVMAQQSIELSKLYCLLNKEEAKAGRDEVLREDFESIVADLVKEGFFQLKNERVFV